MRQPCRAQTRLRAAPSLDDCQTLKHIDCIASSRARLLTFKTLLTVWSRRAASMSRMSISSLASRGTLFMELGPIWRNPMVPTASMAPASSVAFSTASASSAAAKPASFLQPCCIRR